MLFRSGGFGDRHNGGVVWRLSYESGEVYPDGASGRRAVLCGMEDGKHLSGHADAFSEQRLQCDRYLFSGAGRQSRADADAGHAHLFGRDAASGSRADPVGDRGPGAEKMQEDVKTRTRILSKY